MKYLVNIRSVMILSWIFYQSAMLQGANNPLFSGAGINIIAPVTITSSGNYRLANDITTGGITISADNVFLDMNNKSITGSGATISSSGHKDIVIANGLIQNNNSTGISFSTCQNVEISNVDFINGTAAAVSVITTTLFMMHDCNIIRYNNNGGSPGLISLNDTHDSIITDCNIQGNTSFNNGTSGALILLNKSDNNQLSNLSMEENLTGNVIQLEGASNNSISECMILKNSLGQVGGGNPAGNVIVAGFSTASPQLLIDSCLIETNTVLAGPSPFFAISLIGASNSVVRNNVITKNGGNTFEGISNNTGATNKCILLNNVLDNNTAVGPTSSDGIFVPDQTSARNNIVKNTTTSAGSVTGFNGSGNHVVLLNEAQKNGGNNFTAAFPSAVATLNPATGVLTTVSIGYDNISVTLPV